MNRSAPIAMLKKKVFTEQINIWVDHEMKARYRTLKEQKGVDVAEEARKALRELVDRLERAVS